MLDIKDTFVKDMVIDNYCDLAFFESIQRTSTTGDKLEQVYQVSFNDIKKQISQLSHFIGSNDFVRDFPPKTTLNEQFNYFIYTHKYYELNINIQPAELEILIPYLYLDNQMYYTWIPLPSMHEYLIDTGNSSITLMTLSFFDNVYTHLIDPKNKELTLIPNSKNEKVALCGVGGINMCHNNGIIDLYFRITKARLKGIFHVECLIVDQINEESDTALLIGNRNIMHPSNNNLNKILHDRKIALKFHS
jgi:hypothetical protein